MSLEEKKLDGKKGSGGEQYLLLGDRVLGIQRATTNTLPWYFQGMISYQVDTQETFSVYLGRCLQQNSCTAFWLAHSQDLFDGKTTLDHWDLVYSKWDGMYQWLASSQSSPKCYIKENVSKTDKDFTDRLHWEVLVHGKRHCVGNSEQ